MRSRISSSLLLGLVVAAVGCAGAGHDGKVGELSVACPAQVPAWAAYTTYATGAIVSYNGADYQCIQGHTSLPDWTPAAVPALWEAVTCSSGGGSPPPPTGGTGGTGGGGSGGTTGGGSCDPSAWVYMGNDANACNGHIGESCGWTTTNLNQGYHCANTSWGTGCEPGGTTCPGGGTTNPPPPPPPPPPPTGGTGGTGGGGGSTGNGNGSLVFSAYKDTSINMNWNTNVITTNVSGSPTPLTTDLPANGGKTITLAFATGECGSENWGGVQGAAMGTANAQALASAGIKYIISTGGAAGSFTCGSDAGFSTFISRWATSGLIGVDFDIEGGQSQDVLNNLVQRVKTAHGTYPNLRFSFTLATLANNNGGSSATSLGSGAPDSFNVLGDNTINAIHSIIGSGWASYITINLMTMDYGGPSAGVCVVSGGVCEMGQSALQAAYNLHDHWGVPWSGIELTPMIGGNDTQGEVFTTGDADTISSFAKSNGLGGIHYWSYDRDTDCPAGSASPTCNSVGGVGAHGYLKRFLADGLTP